MRPLVVFDLDGVLADVRHRVRHLEGRRKDWDAFFAAAGDDPPLDEGVRQAREAAGEADVAYLTGRPERCRSDTEAWLGQHGLPAGTLVMRSEGDHRPARELKPPLLRRLVAGRELVAVVDDDPAVVAAYRADGWPVLHATWASDLPELHRAQESDGRT